MANNTPNVRNHNSLWTIKEIEFIEENYSNIPAKEIAEILGRNINAVRAMALKVGAARWVITPWTEQEIAVVKAYYNRGAGLQQVQERLPHRDRDSIRKQAAKAGVTRQDVWPAEAVRFLKEHYGKRPIQEIADILNKTHGAVKNKANILKLAKTRRREWTRKEEAVLRSHFSETNNLDEIHALLPHRSRQAISAHATIMGLRRKQSWSPAEIRIMQQFYPLIGKRVAEKLPGRTITAIRSRAEKLGLRRYPKKDGGKSVQDIQN
ncbi:MAG TPA: hypothetical protein VGI71_18285 [Scandinavium sp.]|jgi:hypothetical protein